MKVFNARHFLRNVAARTLHEFVQGHVLAPRLVVDWSGPDDTLSGYSVTRSKRWSTKSPPPISPHATAKHLGTICCSGPMTCGGPT